ncbi:MAG: hypothetical protein ACYCT1_20605 [Steroidobacteraceae bacterium]
MLDTMQTSPLLHKQHRFLDFPDIPANIGQKRFFLLQLSIHKLMVEEGKNIYVYCLRKIKFTETDKKVISFLLWLKIQEDPTQHISDYVSFLEEHEFFCSREYVRQIFKCWRWSFKRPTTKQIQKYSQKNVEYYYGYVSWLQNQNWIHLKFMDEVHFVSRGLIF